MYGQDSKWLVVHWSLGNSYNGHIVSPSHPLPLQSFCSFFFLIFSYDLFHLSMWLLMLLKVNLQRPKHTNVSGQACLHFNTQNHGFFLNYILTWIIITNSLSINYESLSYAPPIGNTVLTSCMWQFALHIGANYLYAPGSLLNHHLEY